MQEENHKSMHEKSMHLISVCILMNSATFTCLNNADFILMMVILHDFVHTEKCTISCSLVQKWRAFWGRWEFRMKGRALFSGREARSIRGERRKIKKVEVFFRLSVRRSRHLIGCSTPTLWANWRMILKNEKRVQVSYCLN